MYRVVILLSRKMLQLMIKIEQMRLSATKVVLERRDTIVVAIRISGLWFGDPIAICKMMLHLQPGAIIDQRQILAKLAELQYHETICCSAWYIPCAWRSD